MITKSPKTALKIILGGLFILSFIIVSCNNEKKAAEPSTTDTTGKGPNDTGTTKPVKELN